MRMKIIIITASILFGLSQNNYAQSDLSFYHLGEATPQSNMYNPVFFPDARFFISLPIISGISNNFNNSENNLKT